MSSELMETESVPAAHETKNSSAVRQPTQQMEVVRGHNFQVSCKH